MKKHWLYLILGLALIINSSCAVNAQDDEGGWWDVSSESDVTIDEALETKPTSTSESSEEAKDTEKSEETENKEEEKQVITYTVVPGDTLCSIALRYLGSASRYPEIAALNPELISDPNVILTGWNLKIQLDGAAPAEEAAAADPEPEVEVTDESSESSEVAEPEEEKTNAEKIAELQKVLDEANGKLPEGFGLVDFNGNTVKYLVEKGIISKEELAALSPADEHTWRINNGKIELVNAKNVALTPEEIAALDAANAAKKNGEEDAEKMGLAQRIGKMIDEGVEKVGEGLKKGVEGLKKGVETVGEGIKKGVETVGEGVKKGVETVGKGLKTFGNWLNDRIEYNRVTRVARAQNALDTLVTTGKVVTAPVRALGSGLVSGIKGFFVGGEDNGFVNGAKKVFDDTIESAAGLKDRRQERIDNALEKANYGGSTTHTSSSGTTHGGSGRSFGGGGGHRF